jgi:uncharacterized phage protein (TIGR01671 family)
MSIKKFRAWDKQLKEWAYFTLDELAQGSCGLIWMHLENWCQSTGLTDKNGLDIWEGDLLQYENATTGRSTENILEVSFEKGRFVAYGKNRKEYNASYLGTPSFSKNFKVIGNIYQNKDVLN